jgi:hypothetical protein
MNESWNPMMRHSSRPVNPPSQTSPAPLEIEVFNAVETVHNDRWIEAHPQGDPLPVPDPDSPVIFILDQICATLAFNIATI